MASVRRIEVYDDDLQKWVELPQKQDKTTSGNQQKKVYRLYSDQQPNGQNSRGNASSVNLPYIVPTAPYENPINLCAIAYYASIALAIIAFLGFLVLGVAAHAGEYLLGEEMAIAGIVVLYTTIFGLKLLCLCGACCGR